MVNIRSSQETSDMECYLTRSGETFGPNFGAKVLAMKLQ